ncbi:unnamed protein product [Candidula unifasciata]|uniref:Uracil-DNA glycosylase n=1 Tax=Candidula unifasciata TaxID=100452 RepID=A0A8S4A4I7_9EUPU|nr:unnamed protein product [Candidula unifasciata]
MKACVTQTFLWLTNKAVLQRKLYFTMSQSKISAFFKSPSGQKRTRADHITTADVDKSKSLTNVSHYAKPPIKRSKTIEKDSDVKDLDTASKMLNSEQDRIEQNKIAAKLKLLKSKTNGLVVNIGPSWFTALEAEFSKEYFSKLSQFIATEREKSTIYPPPEHVFTWTTACDIRSVKVVIIGQDPYHGPKQAHGLCFSVLPGVKPPPSLENMFKELESDIEGFKHAGHGNLIGWAQQGVLLLNACLTVRAGQPNSHAGKGWEKFTDATIHWLNSNLKGLVFLVWGAYAQKKGACIDKKKHHILTAVHPSPLSAHRGFFGCKHFSHCNELLIADGQKPINWKHLPETV